MIKITLHFLFRSSYKSLSFSPPVRAIHSVYGDVPNGMNNRARHNARTPLTSHSLVPLMGSFRKTSYHHKAQEDLLR